MSERGNGGVVDYLPLANALWPLSSDELQLLAASQAIGQGLRSAAAVTADLKESIGADYSGQMQQSVLVSLAARLSAIQDLDPEDAAARVRPTLQIARLKLESERHRRATRLKTLITIGVVAALFLLVAALAAARGIIPNPLGAGGSRRSDAGWPLKGRSSPPSARPIAMRTLREEARKVSVEIRGAGGLKETRSKTEKHDKKNRKEPKQKLEKRRKPRKRNGGWNGRERNQRWRGADSHQDWV